MEPEKNKSDSNLVKHSTVFSDVEARNVSDTVLSQPEAIVGQRDSAPILANLVGKPIPKLHMKKALKSRSLIMNIS